MANEKTVTRPYARAVLELAQTTNSYAQWSQMLQFLDTVIRNPKVNELVRNLAIPSSVKADFINGIDDKILNSFGKNLVKVLAHYKRLLIIPELYKLYEEMRREQERQLTAQLYVAREIATSELERLRAEFAKELDASLTIQQQIDPNLIGGGKLKIGDRVLEASVKANLTALYQHLTQEQDIVI